MDYSAGDDRALASGIIIFIAMIVVGALVFIALNEPVTSLFTTASGYTDNAAAQDHINLLEDMWGAILVFVTFVAGLFIIARAVVESRRP